MPQTANPTRLARTFEGPLPSFRRPPVVEVALAVQFERLDNLDIPHLGALWTYFRDEFPKTEVRAPAPSEFEKFGDQGLSEISIRIVSDPVTPRCWFINEKGTELIQVQPDRFVFNWRKAGTTEDYPRYGAVRSQFIKRLDTIQRALTDLNIGVISPNQCAITYINHIFQGEGWSDYKQFGDVLTVWAGKTSDHLLPVEIEDIGVKVRYIMTDDAGTPIGRLNVNAEPRFMTSDQSRKLLYLALNARGAPLGSGTDGILSFLDVGREYVVRGFTALTTKRMHSIWERYE